MTFCMNEMEKSVLKKLKAKYDLPKCVVHDMLRVLFDSIQENIMDGEKIRLEGVGSVFTSKRKPRVGRNPKTGEKVDIPSRTGIRFRVSTELYNKINRKK